MQIFFNLSDGIIAVFTVYLLYADVFVSFAISTVAIGLVLCFLTDKIRKSIGLKKS